MLRDWVYIALLLPGPQPTTLASALRNSSASTANLQPKTTQNPADTQLHVDPPPEKLFACDQEKPRSRVHPCDQSSHSSQTMRPSHAVFRAKPSRIVLLSGPHAAIATAAPLPADPLYCKAQPHEKRSQRVGFARYLRLLQDLIQGIPNAYARQFQRHVNSGIAPSPPSPDAWGRLKS